MVRLSAAATTRLNLSGFERVVTKVDLGHYERVVARPCELAVAAVLSLAGLEQAAVVTTRLDLSSFEQAMAKLNAGDFEWAMVGLGELGTRAIAVGPNSDGGTWGRLERETWWRARAEDLRVDWALIVTKAMSLAKWCQ